MVRKVKTKAASRGVGALKRNMRELSGDGNVWHLDLEDRQVYAYVKIQ